MNSRRSFLIIILTSVLFWTKKSVYACNLTAKQPKGPFYKSSNKSVQIDLTNNGKAAGKKIQISGKVMDAECKIYPNSIIKVWQANSFGKYNHINDLSKNKKDNNFSGYTTLKTDKNCQNHVI